MENNLTYQASPLEPTLALPPADLSKYPQLQIRPKGRTDFQEEMRDNGSKPSGDNRNIETIANALGGRQKTGGGWMAHCPAHDDRTPSLSIDQTDDGKILVNCLAGCSQEAVIDKLKAIGVWSNQVPPVNQENIEQARIRSEERTKARQRRYDAAAALSFNIWNASSPALPDNPYLVRKRINPTRTLREIDLAALVGLIGYHPQTNGQPLAAGRILIVPLGDDRMTTVEMIDANGRKSALMNGQKKECFWACEKRPEGDGDGLAIIIGEGVATTITAVEQCGGLGIAALSCGNLLAVSRTMRTRYPQAEITLLADLVKTTGQPDPHAIEAARKIGAKLAIPNFGKDRPEGMTDFNDLFILKGPSAVKACFDTAVAAQDHAAQEEGLKPDPLPELSPVEPFDFFLLPDVLRPWAKDIVERMGCPADFVGVGIMIALATVIGRKVGIRPQAHTDWTVVPNLWGLIVGRPGILKSPSLEAALAPLNRLQAKADENHREHMAEFKRNLTIAKMRAEAGEKAAKRKLTSDPTSDVSALLAVDDPEAPKARRYKTNDSTLASLGEVLRQNPNGILVYRDELVSLLKGLDREDNAEARGFYLTACNGDSPYTLDRIARGLNLRIEAVCISLLGGTQPGRLAEYIRYAVKGGAADDGLIQRFSLLVWPDVGGEWKDVDRLPDSEANKLVMAVFDRLDKIDPTAIGAEQDTDSDGNPTGIPYLRFSPEPLTVFQEWRGDLEKRLRSGELHPALESHLAKFRKAVPALALIIHLADGGSGPVTKEAILKALKWSSYLESHARRAYGAVANPDVTAAKAILRRLKSGHLTTPFSSRDIYRQGWAMLSDRQEVSAALNLLVEYGYLASEQVNNGGRPTTVYELLAPGSKIESSRITVLTKSTKTNSDSFDSTEGSHFPKNTVAGQAARDTDHSPLAVWCDPACEHLQIPEMEGQVAVCSIEQSPGHRVWSRLDSLSGCPKHKVDSPPATDEKFPWIQ